MLRISGCKGLSNTSGREFEHFENSKYFEGNAGGTRWASSQLCRRRGTRRDETLVPLFKRFMQSGKKADPVFEELLAIAGTADQDMRLMTNLLRTVKEWQN